jgi:hypothetical protein
LSTDEAIISLRILFKFNKTTKLASNRLKKLIEGIKELRLSTNTSKCFLKVSAWLMALKARLAMLKGISTRL